MPYKHRPLWLQFTPAVSSLLTMHCEELGFTLLKAFTKVLEGPPKPFLVQAQQQAQFPYYSSQSKSSQLKPILAVVH